jgi:hypothetical protein
MCSAVVCVASSTSRLGAMHSKMLLKELRRVTAPEG